VARAQTHQPRGGREVAPQIGDVDQRTPSARMGERSRHGRSNGPQPAGSPAPGHEMLTRPPVSRPTGRARAGDGVRRGRRDRAQGRSAHDRMGLRRRDMGGARARMGRRPPRGRNGTWPRPDALVEARRRAPPRRNRGRMPVAGWQHGMERDGRGARVRRARAAAAGMQPPARTDGTHMVDDDVARDGRAVRPRDHVLLGQAQHPAGLDEVVVLQRPAVGLMHAAVQRRDGRVGPPVAQEARRDRAEIVPLLHDVQDVVARQAQRGAGQRDEQNLTGPDAVGVGDGAGHWLRHAARGAHDRPIVGQPEACGHVVQGVVGLHGVAQRQPDATDGLPCPSHRHRAARCCRRWRGRRRERWRVRPVDEGGRWCGRWCICLT